MASPARVTRRRSSRGVKHDVHRSNVASSPASLRTVATSWLTPEAASKVSPSSRKRTTKYDENPVTGPQRERSDEEGDFLLRPLGERVPQVRRPGVRSYRLEEMMCHMPRRDVSPWRRPMCRPS